MTGAGEPSAFKEEILVKLRDRYASMVVRVWKPGGKARATVFCIHDFTGNGRDFDFLAAFLCRNGYQVVCPDILGRGQSAYLEGAAPYDADVYNRCLRALGDFGSQANHFIGSSWGATTLILAWSLAPWKIGKLILVEPPMVGNPALDAVRDTIVSDCEAVFDDRQSAEDHVIAAGGFGPGIDPADLRAFAAARVREDDGRFRLAVDPAATENFAVMREQAYDLFPIAARIGAPILLMHSQNSALLDRDAIDRYRVSRNDRWAVETPAGSPMSLMRIDQALIVLGFLTAA